MMNDPWTPEHVRAFWARQAVEHGLSPSASWSDHQVIELEIQAVAPYLTDGDRVLDVGCANGFSTLRWAASRHVTIRGVDAVPEMIDQAQARLRTLDAALRERATFTIGDVLALPEPSGVYDKVIAVRVMINLGDPERQLRGVRECARVLRPGGLLLLSEATVHRWDRLNRLRA